jgi:hypothetical protein
MGSLFKLQTVQSKYNPTPNLKLIVLSPPCTTNVLYSRYKKVFPQNCRLQWTKQKWITGYGRESLTAILREENLNCFQFCFLGELGFELRALHWQSRHSSLSHTSSPQRGEFDSTGLSSISTKNRTGGVAHVIRVSALQA